MRDEMNKTTDRLSIKELREYSARKTRPAVETWLRANGWFGLLDADGWPIVSAMWWAEKTSGKVAPYQEYSVDVDALKRAA